MQGNQTHFQSFKEYFESLDVFQKAGLFLWPSVLTDELTDHEKELFSQIKPSGVVLFKRNLKEKNQSKRLISELSALCHKEQSSFANECMISADEEGGRVSRFPLGLKTKPVLEFVTTQDKQGLKNQVLRQIEFAQEIGVNCILAPVLDIFTEPQNTVIGDRSFGHTAEQVCEYAEIVFDAMEAHKIFSCGKHFPGHGNTKADSHLDSAVSDVDIMQMRTREWVPFQYFIERRMPLIMAAHVITPRLSSNLHTQNIPATLNVDVLTGILRQQLGFEGLILSDDLRMGAIQKYYQTKGIEDNYLAHACIDALYAGCDILLSCHSIVEEYVIIESIAKKMQESSEFFELCCDKAYRQFILLSSHFAKK